VARQCPEEGTFLRPHQLHFSQYLTWTGLPRIAHAPGTWQVPQVTVCTYSMVRPRADCYLCAQGPHTLYPLDLRRRPLLSGSPPRADLRMVGPALNRVSSKSQTATATTSTTMSHVLPTARTFVCATHTYQRCAHRGQPENGARASQPSCRAPLLPRALHWKSSC
jgi:hypothetical protein